ncbi:MAG: hypothetical protein QM606_10660, partial [Leucobacter sp.]
MDYATEVADVTAGITELSTLQEDAHTLVQPTSNGVDLINVLDTASAPSQFRTTFDLPENTELIEAPDGMTYFVSNGEYLGALLNSEATDASGHEVPVTYIFENSTLTQKVDLSATSIAYPVVQRMAWGYVYQYNLKKTPTQNYNLLKKCFNCYFPVPGAPKKYPTADQVLPLRPGGFNFSVTVTGHHKQGNIYWFKFDANKGHLDGEGSWVNFNFTQAAAGAPDLTHLKGPGAAACASHKNVRVVSWRDEQGAIDGCPSRDHEE